MEEALVIGSGYRRQQNAGWAWSRALARSAPRHASGDGAIGRRRYLVGRALAMRIVDCVAPTRPCWASASAAPASLTPEEGRVVFANENMPGWTGTRLADLDIGGGLPITVENDVRALAYGEAVMGAGVDYDSLLCVTVGTGIGGALIMDGEVWHGADYSAGEIGYLVVDWEDGDEPVILDQYASGLAIERAYQAAAGRRRASAADGNRPAGARRRRDGRREAIDERSGEIGRYPGGLRHIDSIRRRWWSAAACRRLARSGGTRLKRLFARICRHRSRDAVACQRRWALTRSCWARPCWLGKYPPIEKGGG